MDIMNEIKMQIAQLNMWTKAYDEGNPEVSDKEWDDAYFRLLRLEQNTGIILPNSPTQRIDYKVVNELKKVKHNHFMSSLAKTKDWDEFLGYFGDKDVIGMLKLDGLTLSLRYLDGKLVSAETRGNGEIGEDVYHNALVIPSIPKKIAYKDELIIDGEIICTQKDFEAFSDEYANSRNFASGSIRLLDAKECAKRKLTFVVWNIEKGLNEDDKFLTKLNDLEDLGFIVVPWTSSFDWDAKEFLINQAKELGYPIDGLVGRFDDVTYGKSLGATGHHTKAAYAFKFYDEEYETELLNITWTMGRTGILTPVAIFNPVDDGESVIERASLHNVSVMREMLGEQPYRGQKIKVAKMNQIIPQIVWAGPDSTELNCGAGYWLKTPDKCPCCGEGVRTLSSDSGVLNLTCINPNCEGKLINKLDHYAGKKGLDIKGLSKATLEKLIDWGWVNNIKDLYFLREHRAEWVKKPGFGPKSVDNLLTAINGSKDCELHSFITAIGIPLIGSTYSKLIAKHNFDWHNFRECVDGRYDFTKINGFGYEMLASIRKFNYEEADELVNILNISNSLWKNPKDNFEYEELISESKLKDVKVCITGSLTIYKNRAALQSAIEDAGGKVVSSVTKATNILINNDSESTSSKNIKAKSLGIPVMTEKDFVENYL